MITRVSAEFESPELAEIALTRVKSSVKGVHSTNIFYNKISDKAMKLRNGSIYTILPTAVTTHNYLTAVMLSPSSEDVIIEPYRSRKTNAYVVCEEESVDNVSSVLRAMGASFVKRYPV